MNEMKVKCRSAEKGVKSDGRDVTITGVGAALAFYRKKEGRRKEDKGIVNEEGEWENTGSVAEKGGEGGEGGD